jgi:4-amino-4-deoxy-L-arabinose transferase-like glycosyltransferase
LSRRDRVFALLLAAIAVAALCVRLTFTLAVDPEVPKISDASAYHLLANNLAKGRGYIRPFDFELLPGHPQRASAEYPPLFPTLLSVAARLGLTGVKAQRIFLCFVGTATVVLVGLLGRRVAGRRVGLVAAAIAAAYPMLFLSDAVLMAETLYALLVTVTLILAYRAANRPTPGNFALVGLTIGLATLTRAEAVFFALVLVIPLAFGFRAIGRRRALLAATAIGVAVLVVVPWTVRNTVRLHAFVPISNNLGTAVDGANCDLTYRGSQIGLWRETFSVYGKEARRKPQAVACFEGFAIERRGFDEAEVTSFHRRSGTNYARHHAGRVPLVMAVRWLRTWGVYAPGQQVSFESLEGRPRRWQAIGTGMYWGLLPLAVGGAVVMIRRRTRVWPLLSTAVVVSITTVLTYGQQRFRIAAEPAIVVLAAVTLVTVGDRLRRRQGASRVAVTAAGWTP